MHIEIVRSASELERLGPDWGDLVASSAMDSPFLQWEWCSTWWRHYGPGHELVVLVARDGGKLIGLAPLYMKRGWSGGDGGMLRFLGTGEVHSEHLNFVLRHGRETETARAVMGFLLRDRSVQWRLLRLTDVAADGLAAAAIESHLAESGNVFRAESGNACWTIELADSWDEFLRRVSRNRREKFRRARRDMEKHRLEFHEVSREEEIEAAWADLKRLHQLRWEKLGEAGCFSSARFEAFHRELLRPLWRREMLALSMLRCGSETVAASYCLRSRGRVCFYQGGVDPDWMHCRPGHALRVCELRRAIERGDRVYDFLAGDMEYKQHWATHQAPTVQFTVAARGLLPQTQFRLHRAARWLKEHARTCLSPGMWSRLRRWKRRAIDNPASPSPRPQPDPVAASELSSG